MKNQREYGNAPSGKPRYDANVVKISAYVCRM